MMGILERVLIRISLLLVSLKISDYWYDSNNIALICYYTLFSTVVEILFNNSTKCQVLKSGKTGRIYGLLISLAVLLGSGLLLISSGSSIMMSAH